MVPVLQQKESGQIRRNPLPQLSFGGEEQKTVPWHNLAQQVPRFQIGRKACAEGHPSSTDNEPCGVCPWAALTLQVPELLVVIQSTQKIIVFGASCPDAVAEFLENIDEIAGPRVIAEGLDHHCPACGVAECMQALIDWVVVPVVKHWKTGVASGLIQLAEDFVDREASQARSPSRRR